MAAKKLFYFLLILTFCSNVHSASYLERSYEYILNLGKSYAPSLMSVLDCVGEEDIWLCAKEKASKILDGWDAEVDKQRRSWQEAADEEVSSTGRTIEEKPSQIGREIENSLNSLAGIVQHGVARALSRKKHESGGIDSITISTGSNEKKKMKKKKPKPAKIHLLHPLIMPMRKKDKMDKGRSFPNGRQTWVVGHEEEIEKENRTVERAGRGIMSELWSVGDEALDTLAEHAVDSENAENGITDKSSFEEQRGKKKKKKKAILKLLILGAVLKAKIGTLLQILSFKLQVKFFIVAVLGLAINLARLWIDLKNKHSQQPQKVIYYEHAQHQHHYDHEEEPGWGPWSRSMDPPEDSDLEMDIDVSNSPFRAHERKDYRPFPSKVN